MPRRRLTRLSPFVLLLFALWPSSTHAEALDDAGINALYGDLASAVQNYDMTQDLMEKRLDPSYKAIKKITQDLKSYEPRTSFYTMDRMDTIGTRMNEFNAMQIQQYQQSLKDLNLAADKKTATVTHISYARGLMTIPTEGGTKETLVQYEDSETCNDTIGVVDQLVKLLHSNCEETLSLHK